MTVLNNTKLSCFVNVVIQALGLLAYIRFIYTIYEVPTTKVVKVLARVLCLVKLRCQRKEGKKVLSSQYRRFTQSASVHGLQSAESTFWGDPAEKAWR